MRGMQEANTADTQRIDWFSFWKLVLIQAQNSFSEKGAQFLLIPLGVWLYHEEGNLEYPLGAIIVLPFILFSPLAGWLSDRFCKTYIIRAMAVTQLVVLTGMFFSLRNHNLDAALAWFCVFAIQATVFSPSKKGIIKDMVGTKRIGFASGIVEMASVLALLIGQLGVFVWFSYLLEPGTDTIWHRMLGDGFFLVFDSVFKPNGVNDGWYAASFPCFMFFILAVVTAIGTFTLPSYRPYETRPFAISLLYEHFKQLGYLWRHEVLRRCEIGIGYFWFFGGTIILMTIQLAKEVSGAGDDFGTQGAELMAWMSGGMVLGGVVASYICRNGIHMGVAFWGGMGMTLACLGLSVSSPGFWLFPVLLVVAGAFASAYLVPLNACLQDRAENGRRGDVIAAGNLVDCFLGLLAVGFQYAMMLLISPSWQFVVMGLMSLGMTFFVLRIRRSVYA